MIPGSRRALTAADQPALMTSPLQILHAKEIES
jgi:hypothetical protein